MIRLFFMPLKDALWNEQNTALLCFVSKKRAERILRARSDTDKRLFLYSALLVRNVLSSFLEVRHEALEFETGANDKPRLKDKGGAYNIEFNFSHTHNAILLAISDEGPVGVDVEAMPSSAPDRKDGNISQSDYGFFKNLKRRILPFNVMEKSFHPSEMAYINEDLSKRNFRFLKCWTRKEAYLKCIGNGIRSDLRKINTLSDNIALSSFTWKDGIYICSLCALKNMGKAVAVDFSDIRIEHIRENELQKTYLKGAVKNN